MAIPRRRGDPPRDLSRPLEQLQVEIDATLDGERLDVALTHFLHEGHAGAYRGALREMLADAAEGTLYDTVRARLGERAARDARVRRLGPAVLLAYLPETDLAELDRAYQTYVWRIAHPSAALER